MVKHALSTDYASKVETFKFLTMTASFYVKHSKHKIILNQSTQSQHTFARCWYASIQLSVYNSCIHPNLSIHNI